MAAKGAPTALVEQGHLYKHLDLQVAPGIGLDAAFDPAWWAHVSAKYKLCPFDRITLLAEDRTFRAELLVLSAGPGFAKMTLLSKWEASATDVAALDDDEESPLLVKWDSPATKYAVIRRKDRVKLQSGFDTKADAQAFVANYQRSVNA